MKNKIKIEKNKKTGKENLLLNGVPLKGVINIEFNYSYGLDKKEEIVKVTFINSDIEITEVE